MVRRLNDGTDLTITGNNINLTATADVVIPADVGITFGSGDKIEGVIIQTLQSHQVAQ